MAKRRRPTLDFWIWLIVAGIVAVLAGLALKGSLGVGERNVTSRASSSEVDTRSREESAIK